MDQPPVWGSPSIARFGRKCGHGFWPVGRRIRFCFRATRVELEAAILGRPDPRTRGGWRSCVQTGFYRYDEEAVVLDPLEFLHAPGPQVPDPRQHLVRCYGVYANRSRTLWQRRWESPPWGEEDPGTGEIPGGSGPERARSASRPGSRAGSWARLLRRILEVDPLPYPRCEVEMAVVAVLTEPHTMDRILDHRDRGGGHDPIAQRAPPTGEVLQGGETVH